MFTCLWVPSGMYFGDTVSYDSVPINFILSNSDRTIINGCFMSRSRCGTLKNPYCSVAISAEHIGQNLCSPSPVMVTSPYE